jgi:hypothetical protein
MKEKKKLWCLDLLSFKNLCETNGWDKEVPNDIAIISIIGSPQCRDDEEEHICHGDNVLNLDFDDCSPQAFGLDENVETYTYKSSNTRETTLQFITNEMAKKAVEFINRNIGKDFYIHCFAGVSRSQAFVSYILQNYPQINWETNPQNPCEFPNYFVKFKLNDNMK